MQQGGVLPSVWRLRRGYLQVGYSLVAAAAVLGVTTGCSLREGSETQSRAGATAVLSTEPSTTSRSAVPPEPPPPAVALTSADQLPTLTAYQRVRISGTYLHGEGGHHRYVQTSLGQFRIRDQSLLIKLPPLGTMRQQVPTGQHVVVEASVKPEDLPGTNAQYSIGNAVLLTTE